MVSSVAYVRKHTGIELSLPLDRQDVGAFDAALRHGRVLKTINGRVAPSHLEAIYDAVVGIDRTEQRGFDRQASMPERLRTSELEQLCKLATGLRDRHRTSAERSVALNAIANAAGKYGALLRGDRKGVMKDPTGIGSRHTLIRCSTGNIFEMTNSMTHAEIERFRRKTGMRVSAIEKTASCAGSERHREPVYRVVLGQGAFGKARIARNICSDQYVAVKKIHPALMISPVIGLNCEPTISSRFTTLPESKKSMLRSLGDAVIVPLDERTCASRKSIRINEANRLLNSLKGLPTLDAKHLARHCEHPGLPDTDYSSTRDSMPAAIEAIRLGNGRLLRTDVESTYSFSQLGLATVEDAAETMRMLRALLEGKKSDSGLSAAAIALLERYVEAYIPPPAGKSDAELSALRRSQALRIFDHPDFHFKDPRHNERYVNTLGKKLLAAMSKFHSTQCTHRDIKPANIVFCQEENGEIAVKLIDVDLIEVGLKVTEKPQAGTPLFMAPESYLLRQDGSKVFDAEKGDGYGIGMTLKRLLGTSIAQLCAVSHSQNLKSMQERTYGAGQRNWTANDHAAKAQAITSLRQMPVEQAATVTDASAIKQISTLKDAADLLLQTWVGSRHTPTDVLRSAFFQNQTNFLSESEFSKKTNFILRFENVRDA